MRMVCEKKIQRNGTAVGLSFYAFFANKNDQPEVLLEVATWWIQTHGFDHFEKATTILKTIERESLSNLADA